MDEQEYFSKNEELLSEILEKVTAILEELTGGTE